MPTRFKTSIYLQLVRSIDENVRFKNVFVESEAEFTSAFSLALCSNLGVKLHV